jgi:hypothetical protein
MRFFGFAASSAAILLLAPVSPGGGLLQSAVAYPLVEQPRHQLLCASAGTGEWLSLGRALWPVGPSFLVVPLLTAS